MICSSVNRAFICPSFCWADSTQIWRSFRGAGQPLRRFSGLPVVGCDEPWRLRNLRSTALELMLDQANMSFELGLLKPRYIKFGDCIISRLDTGAAIALTCDVPFTMTSIDVVNLTGDTCVT